MKTTSIEKLNQVLSIAKDVKENYVTMCSESIESKAALIIEYVRAVLVAEEMDKEVKDSKFDIFKYCAKDEVRPVLNGVFHKDGYQVATDGCVLIKMKANYPAELEGKIVLKDGSFQDGKYPFYDKVIPDYDSMKEQNGRSFYHIDRDAFYAAIDKARKDFYLEYGRKVKFEKDWLVKIGDNKYCSEFIYRLIQFMDKIKATQIEVINDCRTLKVTGSDGSVAVVIGNKLDEEPIYTAKFIWQE